MNQQQGMLAPPEGIAEAGQVSRWPGRWFRFVRDNLIRTLVFVVLTAVPLLFFSFALEREFRSNLLQRQAQEVEDLEQEIALLLRGDYIPRAFEQYFAQSFSSRDNPDYERFLLKEIAEVRRCFPGAFEFVAFNQKNVVIPEVSDFTEFHGVLNRFAEDFKQWVAGNAAPINEHLPDYRGLLGPYAGKFNPLPNTGLSFLIKVNAGFSRRRALLLIPHRPLNGPWMMIWVSYPENPREFAFRFLHHRQASMTGLNDIIDISTPPETWGKNMPEARPHLMKALGALGEQPGKAMFAEGFLWAQVPISVRQRLVFARRDAAGARFDAAVRSLRTGVAIFLGLSFILPFWFRTGAFSNISLRRKLLFLFVYSTGIPVVLLLYSSQSLFTERRQVLEEKVFREHIETLKELNRRIIEYQGWLDRKMKQIQSQTPADETALEIVVNIMRETCRVLQPELAFLNDASGRMVFKSVTANGKKNEPLLPFLGVNISKNMATLNGTPPSRQQASRESFLKGTLESVGLDVDGLSADLAAGFHGMCSVQFSAIENQFFSPRFYDSKGVLRYSGWLVWSENLKESFLKRRLTRFQANLPDIHLEVSQKKLTFLRSKPGPLNDDALRDVCTAMGVQITPVHQKIERDGQTFLVTGMSGQQLKMATIAISTDENIRAGIRETAFRLFLISLFLSLLALGMGVLISRHLFVPIGHLAQGMTAMKNREFAARVPVLSNDEFGRLSATFNEMMEGMADLEVARIVQDTFFPQKPLGGEGWEVCGTSLPASRVGGDYFDYFSLADGRWLILIGDVVGHGVPAALMVAMAKAVAMHPANPPDPAGILDVLNQSFMKVSRRRGMMTCFIGLFDAGTASFLAANAGHNFPCLLQNGQTEELAILNSMLGAKNRKPFFNQPVDLAPKDALIFFTDGLIEALDREKKTIGYDRFYAALPGLLRPTAQETDAAIRAWFQTIAAPGPLNDDVTLVILQKSLASNTLSQ